MMIVKQIEEFEFCIAFLRSFAAFVVKLLTHFAFFAAWR